MVSLKEIPVISCVVSCSMACDGSWTLCVLFFVIGSGEEKGGERKKESS